MVKHVPLMMLLLVLGVRPSKVMTTLASSLGGSFTAAKTNDDTSTTKLLPNRTLMKSAKTKRAKNGVLTNETVREDMVKQQQQQQQQQHQKAPSKAVRKYADDATTKQTTSRAKSKISSRSSLGGPEAATLRRIKREWKDAVKLGIAYDWVKIKNVAEPTDDKYSYVRIGPYGNNLLRWHFSVMGTPNSEYDGGIYHGRVLLPKDYPGSPPRVQLLTPSGRFCPGHDICLSASNYHPETWTPKWTVLSLIDALRLHMLTQANEIGGMTATSSERRRLAKLSRHWAAGKVSHQTMISQGMFLWDGDTASDSRESASATRKADDYEIEMGINLAAIRARDSAQHAERLSSNGSLIVQLTRMAVEVFRSPPRLAFLIFLTLVIFLNMN